MSTSAAVQRLALYAIERVRGRIDDYVLHALSALRDDVRTLVVLAPAHTPASEVERLSEVADIVQVCAAEAFTPSVYADAIRALPLEVDAADEVVLTGDGWFGPVQDLAPVLARMAARSVDVWNMIGASHGPPPAFPGQGFDAVLTPWLWVSFATRVLRTPAWTEYWAIERSFDDLLRQESEVLTFFAAAGAVTASAFDPADYPNGDPAVYSARRLLEDGCPFVSRLPFRLFPPFLDQHAVFGHETLADMAERGFALDPVLQNLARTVRPRALNTVAGLVDALPGRDLEPSAAEILVVAHVSDPGGLDEMLDRVANIRVPYDLVLTTTDGMRASRLQQEIDRREDPGIRRTEIRVTPDDPGRDMSDLFVGCRDLLLGGQYDLVVKVHSRRAPTKTVNRLRYFRRYQLENLLASPGHFARILSMFEREPGLGMVFPPMMHIGYSIAGRGWAGLEKTASKLRDQLGLHVPVDLVSPLAPFGGMWIARPEAIRRMSEYPWRYGHYRGRQRARELAHAQERLLVEVAAEDGYHVRTVLTPEHASISHTALEFKIDDMGSALRGYPLDQILFLHGAGGAGRGGPFTLLRMYLRLNHPRAARLMLPAYRAARIGHRALSAGRSVTRKARVLASARRTEATR